MFGIFGAIGKIFRTLGYLLTGRLNRISGVWATNPDVIGATFDRAVDKKRQRLNQYKNAVGGLIAIDEKKKLTLKQVSEEVVRLEKLKAGALAMARKVVDTKYGGDSALAHDDPEYKKCQTAFKDFSTSLTQAQARVVELETDIQANAKGITDHQNQITSLMRDLEKVKQEKHETIADVVSAKEQKEIADMFNGLSEDQTAQDLEAMRDLRGKAKADARVSRELAGLDSKRVEDDFLAYADDASAVDEFDAALRSTKESKTTAAPVEATKISEN
jgi:phage shock protein A